MGDEGSLKNKGAWVAGCLLALLIVVAGNFVNPFSGCLKLSQRQPETKCAMERWRLTDIGANKFTRFYAMQFLATSRRRSIRLLGFSGCLLFAHKGSLKINRSNKKPFGEKPSGFIFQAAFDGLRHPENLIANAYWFTIFGTIISVYYYIIF